MHFSLIFQPMSLNSKNRTIDVGLNVSNMTFKFEIDVPSTSDTIRTFKIALIIIVLHNIFQSFIINQFNYFVQKKKKEFGSVERSNEICLLFLKSKHFVSHQTPNWDLIFVESFAVKIEPTEHFKCMSRSDLRPISFSLRLWEIKFNVKKKKIRPKTCNEKKKKKRKLKFNGKIRIVCSQSMEQRIMKEERN